MKSRDEILRLLSGKREVLRDRFGVESIALFGSAARGEAVEGSDVDVLVDIPAPTTLFRLAALEQYLAELLGVAEVDVVLRDSIIPALRDSILSSAIHVE